MKRRVLWTILGGMLLALIALVVWALSYTPTTRETSEAWSRGQVIGQTPIKRRVALQSAPDGGVFLVWPNLDGRLEMARIGVDGEMVLICVLPVETEKARDPQLQIGPDGRLHLLWREDGGARPSVRYALLEADGTLVNQPWALADPASRAVDTPRLARDVEGHLHALWADEVGIQWAALSRTGEMLEGPTLLIPEGCYPIVQTDDRGRLHLVWQQEMEANIRSIYYAALDPEERELSGAEEIAEIMLSGRLRLQEVALGLSQDTGYVLWSDYDQSFDRYRFLYAFFPLDVPQQRQVTPWQLKMGDGPMAISPLDGQQTELLVALSERLMGSGQERELQIALLTMEQGEPAEQVVTTSSQASIKPVLIADDRSYLHLAWLETAGFRQYQVVYASTAPEVMENYNALTLWDASNAAFSNVFRLSMVVVAVIAVFIMWAIVPLLGLVIYHLVTSEETLDTVRSRVAIGLALAVEAALAFALPPHISVEASWPALHWVVPAVSVAVAAVVTARVLRRREDTHLFATFFLFTGVNCLLQMVLYLLF